MILVTDFTIDCVPPKATSQMKGIKIINGKPMHFKKKNVAAAEEMMMALLLEHRIKEVLDTPIHLEVHWAYPWRAQESNKAKVDGFIWCDTRPDCSNIIKMFEDCMSKLNFWLDDAQVADLRVKKFWCGNPHIRVKIYKLEPNDVPSDKYIGVLL